MSRYFDYLYIFATVGLTVYGQLILKWRIMQFGPLPVESGDKLRFLSSLLLDPAIFSGFAAAFLASLTWMAAMTKFDLSYAYPFMSLNFVIVLILSVFLLNETVTATRLIGISMIVLGTVIAARA